MQNITHPDICLRECLQRKRCYDSKVVETALEIVREASGQTDISDTHFESEE